MVGRRIEKTFTHDDPGRDLELRARERLDGHDRALNETSTNTYRATDAMFVYMYTRREESIYFYI
jgi:hypothetical protein